jgi:signal transduction histidine kinase
MTEETGKQASPAIGLKQVLDAINLGVVLVRREPLAAVYWNPQFIHIARGKDSVIIKNLLMVIEETGEQILINPTRMDMDIGDGILIGYTIYNISESYILVFLNDVSHKRIVIENKEENQFYDRLSNLLAEVVHEIGNPLTSVTTTLHVLKENIELWDRQKRDEYIQRAVDEIERLTGFLNKMRDFSTIEMPLEKQKLSLKDILEKYIRRNIEILNSNGITIKNVVEPGVEVSVNEDAFYQVILNLLLNSMEVLKKNGRILLKVEEVNEIFVKLLYWNNGPSVSPEILGQIFLPFFTTRTDGKGSGIGLALTQKLMIRMGGKVKAEIPEDGDGMFFVLYVPVSD